jgi:hypothetical protein
MLEIHADLESRLLETRVSPADASKTQKRFMFTNSTKKDTRVKKETENVFLAIKKVEKKTSKEAVYSIQHPEIYPSNEVPVVFCNGRVYEEDPCYGGPGEPYDKFGLYNDDNHHHTDW